MSKIMVIINNHNYFIIIVQFKICLSDFVDMGETTRRPQIKNLCITPYR